MEILAEVRRASMRFGPVAAVGGADLDVARGEIVGLLGANGAGKTTLIRLLLGLLRPSDGVIRLFGGPPSIATRRRVGYVPQTLGLYAGLTVAENWAFTAAAFGVFAPVPAGIGGWRAEVVGRLPLGAQRQVAFAVALSHRPDLLILDEPTSGVGPLGRARLWEDIRAAAGQGVGVLVTTHNMDEAEQCDRLVVMADGNVVARGTAPEIIGGRTVAEVRCDDANRAFSLLDAAGFLVQVHGSVLRVGREVSAVARVLAVAGVNAAAETVPADLEEAFADIVARSAAA